MVLPALCDSFSTVYEFSLSWDEGHMLNLSFKHFQEMKATISISITSDIMTLNLLFPWCRCGYNNTSTNPFPELHRWMYTAHRLHYSSVGWFYALNHLSPRIGHDSQRTYKNNSRDYETFLCEIPLDTSQPLCFSSFKTLQQASKHFCLFLQSGPVSPSSLLQYQLPLPPAGAPVKLYFKVTWALSLH